MSKTKKMITIENVGKRTFSIFVDIEYNDTTVKKPYLLKAGRSVSVNEDYAKELLKSYPRELRDLSKVVKVSLAKDLDEVVASYKAEIEKLKEEYKKSLESKNTEIERFKNANTALQDKIKKLEEKIEKLKDK